MVIFLDTNVFLHYRRFSEIDWVKLTKERSVTIAFPPVTLRELNEKKDGGSSPKLKRRAQAVLVDIEALFRDELRSPVRAGVIAEFIASDPQINFTEHRLRLDLQDDWLIASVLEAKAQAPAERCALVTSDLGLGLKCRGHGIEVLKLSDDLKLPEEDDAETKRLKQLEAENLALKSAAPVLSLLFPGGKTEVEYDFRTEIPFDAAVAEEKLGEAKQKLKKFSVPKFTEGDPETVSAIIAKNFNAVLGYDDEEVKEYNQSLEEYFDDFVNGLREQNAYENLLRRSYKLEIAVLNDGTTPAEDIVVHMHFPDGFSLCFEKDFPSRPELREPPDKPLTKAERMQHSFSSVAYPRDLMALPRDLPVVSRERESASIKQTNSFDVDFEFEKLNHGFSKTLKRMIFSLDQPLKPTSFHIDYEIHAANLPKPSIGRLHVIAKTGA